MIDHIGNKEIKGIFSGVSFFVELFRRIFCLGKLSKVFATIQP